MTTYINRELIYNSELGSFFLAKNPTYAINAKIPIVVIDIEANKAILFNSKRSCVKFLSYLLKRNIQLGTLARYNWIDSGEVIENKFVLLSKPKFISLIPEVVDFNEGSINLTKYNVNLINNKGIVQSPTEKSWWSLIIMTTNYIFLSLINNF
uniref:GIY-YIG homing endonuclease n=1 Tax=Pappia fissilis TaxID=1040649 RepID=UPI002A7F93B0|nr:GIY-YIG homing endonuclease [Pappia fissilis]WOX61262.1 GIY-YIG homing endonuclease [Pappia fissilis]